MRPITILIAALSVSFSSAAASSTIANSIIRKQQQHEEQALPRRGSHISTGFVKPALLASATTLTSNNDNAPSVANKSRANRKSSRGGGGGLNESYGLMSGVFDNEYMQRNIQDLFVE